MISTSLLSQTMHTINAGNYYYSPEALTIEAGDSVEFINDNGFHDVVITSGPEILTLPACSGPCDIGVLVFNTPGEYEYICSIGSHSSLGMVGVITVNETSQILGCTDPYAENYNSNANVNDGSCAGYPDNGNYSLSFDGVDDKVLIGDNENLDIVSDEFTFLTTVKFSDTSEEGYVISKRYFSAGAGYEIRVGNNSIFAEVNPGGSAITLSAPIETDNAFHTIVVSFKIFAVEIKFPDWSVQTADE